MRFRKMASNVDHDTPLNLLHTLMINDLKNSGLTPHHAKILALKPCADSALTKLTERPVGGGYEIPYHDFQGKPLKFSRYKLFQAVKSKTSTMKYWQPADSPPRLYVPPLIDWRAVVADSKLEVWVTEGEKKAAS